MSDEAMWQVKRFGPTGTGRTLFEGIESDARLYLENNYPRVHVEPGSADDPTVNAVLVAPDGSLHAFDGEEWHTDSDSSGEEDADTVAGAPSKRAGVVIWRQWVLDNNPDLSDDDKAWLSSADKADIIAEYGQEPTE